MIQIRKANERGHANHGWLDTWHSFSFAEYFDPENMGFSALRVINEDRIAAGAGFPTHAHRDMEIVTYLLQGALEHRDSMGNGSIIRPGEIQRMSAGSGVTHSEYNASDDQEAHLLQIWIEPRQCGITPGYEQKTIGIEAVRGQMRLIASPDGAGDSATIHQDVQIYATILNSLENLSYSISRGRQAYIHLAHGEMTLNGVTLHAGDGARIQDEEIIALIGQAAGSEALLFDLP